MLRRSGARHAQKLLARRTFLLGLTGAVAALVAFSAAQPYPGATVDSGEYLAIADGVVSGQGLTMPYVGYDEPFHVLEPGERVPLTQFPPGYPAVLAAVQWLGAAPFDAARAINAVCYAITMMLVVGLVLKQSNDLLRALVAAGLLLTADVVIVHSMVWSETVMLAALMGAVALTIRYWETKALRYLLAAGVCAVAASATRFVGVSAVAAIGAALLLSGPGRFSRRFGRAATFTAVCMLPTVLWFVRNATILGTPSEKEPGLYLPGTQHVIQALSTVGGWIVPWSAVMPFVGAVMVIGLGVVIRQVVTVTRPGPASVPAACVWFAAAYLALVLLSRSVLDQNIAFDFRILVPLYVLTVIAVCVSATSRNALAALSVLAVVSVGRGMDAAWSFSNSTVAAYAGDAWRSSPTLAHVEEIPDDDVLITNAPDPIWIWHARASLIIPPRSSLYSGEPNVDYERDVADIRAATRCKDAIVVFFDQPTRKPRRYIEPLLVRGLQLEKVQRYADGEIYDVTEPVCRSEAS